MIQILAIIPPLKRNTSKEIIMSHSTINTANKTTNILAQFRTVANFPVKNRKFKTLTWKGVPHTSEINSIELMVRQTNFSIVLNGDNTLSVVHCDREEMEILGFALFPNQDNSFSFEFNGETFDSEYHNQHHYKLLSFWEKESYNLDELINEWLARIFKVQQD